MSNVVSSSWSGTLMAILIFACVKLLTSLPGHRSLRADHLCMQLATCIFYRANKFHFYNCKIMELVPIFVYPTFCTPGNLIASGVIMSTLHPQVDPLEVHQCSQEALSVLAVPSSCPAPPLPVCPVYDERGVHFSGRKEGWDVLLGIVPLKSLKRDGKEQQGIVRKQFEEQHYTRPCAHTCTHSYSPSPHLSISILRGVTPTWVSKANCTLGSQLCTAKSYTQHRYTHSHTSCTHVCDNYKQHTVHGTVQTDVTYSRFDELSGWTMALGLQDVHKVMWNFKLGHYSRGRRRDRKG